MPLSFLSTQDSALSTFSTSRRRRCRRSRRSSRNRRLAPAMPAELPRRRKLSKLVPDHVLGHEHLEKLVPVVHFKRMAHELRNDRARPRPRPNRGLGARLIQTRDLPEQLLVYERAFFRTSTHYFSSRCSGSLPEP